jgi:hypothetical protein
MRSRFFGTARAALQAFAFGALVVGVVGCVSSRDSFVSPLPAPVFDFTGVWSGTLSQHGSAPISVKWTANQKGDSVAGPLVGATPEAGEFNGTLAGVITDPERKMTLTLTVEAGTIATAPACSASGLGRSVLTDTEISADIDISYGSDCIGVVATEPTETFQLFLLRE